MNTTKGTKSKVANVTIPIAENSQILSQYFGARIINRIQ